MKCLEINVGYPKVPNVMLPCSHPHSEGTFKDIPLGDKLSLTIALPVFSFFEMFPKAYMSYCFSNTLSGYELGLREIFEL